MDCSLPGFSIHGIFRHEYWSGLPFPSPGHLPYPGIEPGSPALEADTLPSEPPGKSKISSSFKECKHLFCCDHFTAHNPHQQFIVDLMPSVLLPKSLYIYHYIRHHSGEGNGTPLQYSCLENPMDGGAWWATVHGVIKSLAQL